MIENKDSWPCIDSKREILVERINKNKNRPLFKSSISTDKKVSELYKERFKYYNSNINC